MFESTASAYIQAGEGLLRAHTIFAHAAFALHLMFFTKLFVEPLVAALPPSEGRRAITNVTGSKFGDHVVIETNVPQWKARG